MKKFLYFILIISIFLILSACGDDDQEKSSRCEPASSQQITFIRDGIQGVQASNDVKNGYAVKSNDFQNAYFVAAKIYGPGIDAAGTDPGVWLISGDKDSPGMTLSVNSFAKEFTSYPDASKTDAAATMSNDGAREAENCAK